jgi:drug/metabolite transporter (DMT)-like permease
MPRTAHYWVGLIALCASAVFAIGLGSVLQYRAIAKQAALSAASEPFVASIVTPNSFYRRASF